MEKKMIKQDGKIKKYDEDIQRIFDYLKQLLIPVEQVNRQRIGFKTAGEKT